MRLVTFNYFLQKVALLSRDELAAALMVPRGDIFSSSLQDCVPCVGCRRSMEELFNRLKEQQLTHATEPLLITPRAEMSVTHEVLYDMRQLFSILSVQGPKLNDIVDSIHKNRRNKRCQLHSLDNHKVRLLSNWEDIWEAMETPCREEVITISSCELKRTTDAYLSKHRFCSECKSKVMTAFHILVQNQEPPKDKDFCPSMYQGIRYCPRKHHLHVLCDTDYIEKLVKRAEPDLCGVRRERHAKTLEAAQEEILTCLGLHIYDRLHRIRQKVLAEEQAWSLLVHVGMYKLQKAFEVALDAKHGLSKIELICQEINKEDEERQQRREQKKQRKKARKKNKSLPNRKWPENRKPQNGNRTGAVRLKKKMKPRCLSTSVQEEPKASIPNGPAIKGKTSKVLTNGQQRHDTSNNNDKGSVEDEGRPAMCGEFQEEEPCGVGEICADCKGEKSTSGSSNSRTNSSGCLVKGSANYESDQVAKICRCSNERQLRHAVGWTHTLQDMLEETHLFCDEDCKLAPEEIDEFHASHQCLDSQRAQLRQNLHQRFMRRVKLDNHVNFFNQRNIANA
ncbi:putative gametogenetin-binding protein 2-like [Apostichopus japonicus]|uniref:Putative gametogenetin-binding protein 2-like n=1 Tax=Stichopus japonicus TaxID=307972 RepID=A0A2G8KSK1_STIJA|nr:putative gametogenetin-binding protein 2-like [Apostichopus japonicus]